MATCGRDARLSAKRWADGMELQPIQKTIVLSVTADPEPDDLVILQEAESSVAEGDTDGVDRVTVVDPFELETWVPGVLAKETVGFAGEVLNLGW